MKHGARFLFVLLAALAVALSGTGVALAEFEEKHSFSGSNLVIKNLIGEVHVEGHDGGGFEVTVRVQGKDASPSTLEINAGSDELAVRFPTSEHRDYVYPHMNGKTTFSLESNDQGWLSAVLGNLMGKHITVSNSGRGLEVWADITVRVPRGSSLHVRHGVGEIKAADVEAALNLDSRSGAVNASGVTGNLIIDTGSGGVAARNVNGRLSIDTGSGGVEAHDVRGDRVHIDTGSGSVNLERIDTENLHVDTGSGSVRASGVSTDSAEIDTGSGRVALHLDRMGSGDFVIDTGSGGITLGLPPNASADVSAETGGGTVDVDLDSSVRIAKQDRNEMDFTVGGGGARVRLDTGSGGVRIVRAE